MVFVKSALRKESFIFFDWFIFAGCEQALWALITITGYLNPL